MAPVEIDPAHVREFADRESFYRWLSENHDKAPEVWIRIHKRASGLRSVTPEEAIEAVLCWGWIDGIRKGLDEKSFFQRYSPRGRRSVWSRKNVETVGRLIADGRMTEHGLKHVEAAKADGRWDRAYGSGKDLKIPPDLQAAIDAEPAAAQMLGRLTEQNRFALAFRVHNLKTEAARRRRIETFVEMLKNGETIYPQKRR
ncbi:YdeI/OmpD-associated family protein [Shinella zoogloeoides]